MRERNAPIWVKAFVAFHLAAITIWALPHPPQNVVEGRASPTGSDWILVGNSRLKRLSIVQSYLFGTGFWQYWDMFAPNPVQTDVWADALVVFRDGTVEAQPYPRMALLPWHLRYIKERYRKFFERAGDPRHSYFWAPFAQRLALEAWKEESNPPIRVTLRKHSRPIAAPGQAQRREYQTEEYYTHEVDQARLARHRSRLE